MQRSASPSFTKDAAPAHAARTRAHDRTPDFARQHARPTPQQSAGNQAVQELFRSGAVRAKLEVSQPGDPDEQEADRAADQVMSGGRCPQCAAGSPPCAACQAKARLRRKADNGGGSTTGAPVPSTARAGAGGQPLSPGTRSFFERGLGADFSRVRIHTGSDATRSARAIRARAFTHGQDIVFNENQFAPETSGGMRLLAHELAHVRQDGDTPSNSADAYLKRQAEPDELFDRGPLQELVLSDGTLLKDSDAYLRDVVHTRIATSGSDAGHRILETLHGDLAALRPQAGEAPPEYQGQINSLGYFSELLTPVVEAIDAENAELIRSFRADAESLLTKMLDDSEQRIKSELIRYGIKIDYVKPGAGDECAGMECANAPSSDYDAVYSMDDSSPAGAGLAKAAGILLERRRQLDRDTKEKNSRQYFYCESGPYEHLCEFVYLPGYEEYSAKVEEQTQDYKKINEQFKAQFPALGAFSELDQDPGQLELVSRGTGADMAHQIMGSAMERLANIATTREGMSSEEGSIWKLRRIVDLTKASKGFEPDGYQSRVIEEEFDEQNSSWLEIALGVLSLAFALLAPVTGGLSLLASAAISTGLAVEHFNNYMLQSAMAGTELDKARAITEEPSMLWLALDIVGAVLDVVPAAGALAKLAKTKVLFSEMRGAVILAEAAKTDQEAAAIIRKAAGGAEKNAGKLAEDVIAHMKLNKGDRTSLAALGGTKAEIAAIEEAAGAGERLIQRQGLVDEVEGAAGRLKVTQRGTVFVCTSPCEMLRERYARALAERPDLLAEVQAVEAQAGQIALATDEAAQKLARAQMRRNLRRLEVKLQAVPTAQRLSQLQRFKEFSQAHPLLSTLDPGAIERILAVSKGGVPSMKGQLLEELLNARLASPEARAAEGGARAVKAAEAAGSQLEFIPGHAIRDANNRLLTDGILGYRKGDRFIVVKIFESKSGAASAEGLERSAAKMTRADWRELADDAVEDVLANHKLANTPDNIKLVKTKYKDELKKVRDATLKDEAGQLRRTLERIAPNESQVAQDIYVNGEKLDVVAGPVSTQMVGVVPSNVDTKALDKALEREGLNYALLKDAASQTDLEAASADLLAKATELGL